MIQLQEELEKWHEKQDPWGYCSSEEDRKRKRILLSEIPQRVYTNVLDIGCGQGFITKDLPGRKIVGVDISKNAIKHAKRFENRRLKFLQKSIFELSKKINKKFDLIIITGVLYPQYIGDAHNLVYQVVDDLLEESGILISVHIDSWYKARFPYLLVKQDFYDYREYVHRLEVYIK